MNKIEDDWDDIPKSYDCFLVAGGSDFRAYEILRKANKRKIKIENVLFFDFDERKKNIDIECEKAYYKYRSLKLRIKEIPCSIKDPSTCIKSLGNHKIDLSIYKNIAIDISCFTKPYFFLILKHLQTIHKLSSITAFYTEPKSYVFPKGLYISYQSSLGPLRVLEIPGYTGSDLRGQKRLLVILLGFDGDLSREINEDVAPVETIVVNGFPGYAPKFKDISLICNEKLIYEQGIDISYSRANNPFETYNLLENLKKKYRDFFINIAPLGTKPMALGACMFAIHHPEARVVYPMPENYMKVTTDRCWNSWAYNIPLIISN
ncbi:hypothetical protein ES705_30065 [subsurface metagenome]